MSLEGPQTANGVADEPLSAEQAKKFEVYKAKCAKNGLLERPVGLGIEDVCDGINDDVVLLRFFRARKYNVEEAYKMFNAVCLAREKDRHCVFYDNIDIDLFDETRNIYPHWTGHRDKRGQPLYYFDMEAVTATTLAAHTKSSESMSLPDLDLPKPSKLESLRSFTAFDYAVRYIIPLCSSVPNRPDPTTPITRAIYIIDIATVSLSQVWSARGWIKTTADFLANTYPEILDRVFILNAPSFFPTIWSWIKGFLDPVTASKLQLVPRAETLSTLSTYIPLSSIPTKYGGELAFELGMRPVLDQELRETLGGLTEYPLGPLKWVNGEGEGERVAVAVGRVGGVKRYERFAVVKTGVVEKDEKIVNDDTCKSELPDVVVSGQVLESQA